MKKKIVLAVVVAAVVLAAAFALHLSLIHI